MFSGNIAETLEARGWTRAIAGDADFNAACHAIELMRKTGLGLIVAGEYGVGKTSLIKAIVGSDDVFKVNLALTTEPLTRQWQEYWAADVYNRDVWLDDLGAEPVTNNYGIKVNPVGDFIIHWHAYHAPNTRMLSTTNLSSPELDNKESGRVYSRLKDLCIPLRLTGKDKREWRL